MQDNLGVHMAIKYTYNPEQHSVLTEVIGQIKLTEILSYIDKLISDPLINKPFLEIVDFSETKDFDFGYYQTNQLIGKLKHLESFNNYQGSILIADKDFIRGMTNIFKVVGEDKAINIKVVSSQEEALSEAREYFS